MSIYILGPSIESVVEPEGAPVVTAGKRGIVLHATKPTEPGGKINFLLAGTSTDQRPAAVYGVYVSPPSLVPSGAARTAEWFMAASHPRGSVVVPPAPVEPADLQIVVPGVKPGIHFVQTVLEYNS